MVYILKADYTCRKSRLGRFFHKIFGKRVSVSGAKISGMPCCIVTVEAAGGICWNEINAVLSGDCDAVMPKGVVPPKDCRIHKISGETLRRRILLNGVLFAVENAAENGKPVMSAGVLDRDGKYSWLISRLMQSVQAVTVVTQDEQGYAKVSDTLFESLGAAPIVIDSAAGLSGCNVIIAPEGLSGFGAVEIADVMFTPDSRDGYSINDACINAPFSPKLLCEYDAFELMTAFGEDRRFASVESLVPHSFILGEKQVPVKDVCMSFNT